MEGSHPLVGQVVGLQLTVVGVLDVDGLVADVRRGCGVVVHHGDRCFLRSHFYKSLEGEEKEPNLALRVN